MPSNVRIIFDHFDEVERAVGRGGLLKAAKAGGYVIEGNAKVNVNKTFSDESSGGAGLGGSIQTTVKKSTETRAEVNVGPTVIYGRIQELGGVILPVHAKVLSWVDNGERVFAKMVHLPARPYLRPALDDNKDDIKKAIGVQVQKDIEKAAR